MNRALKCFTLLLLPFVAACSAASGLGKKDRDFPTTSRAALVRSSELSEDVSDRSKTNSLAEFCSYSPSASPKCGLLDTLEKSCEPRSGDREGVGPDRSVSDGREKTAPGRPLRFPVATGCLSSPFGYRHGVFHGGVDITAPTGTPIVASADGKVLSAGVRKGYGRYGKSVIIDHGKGLCTHYAHASAVLVRAGQKVRKGQEIARVGSTGRTTCPHCHLEVQEGDRLHNPMSYFPDKELQEVRVARNFSNKPAGPVVARSPLTASVSRHR